MKTTRNWLPIPVLALAVGCGPDAEDPPMGPGVGTEPSTIMAVLGSGQTGEVARSLRLPPTVLVEDSLGRPVEGVQVRFEVTEGGGSVSEQVVETSNTGRAATSWVMGTTAGSNQRLVATVVGDDSIEPALFTARVVAIFADFLVQVSGDSQTGAPGTVAPEPLTVRVVDEFGNGIQGQIVKYYLLTGTGSLSPVIDTTNASGLSLATWTLGPEIGTQEVVVYSPGLTGSPQHFTALVSP